MADPLESHIDVLIIGAGPAGLAAAYWMARCGIKARIVDKKSTKVFHGHADGLRPRTLELFDSMGIYDRVIQESWDLGQITRWEQDRNGKLRRETTKNFGVDQGTPFHDLLLGQGRVERFLLDDIRASSEIEVERSVIVESLDYDKSSEADHRKYPIRVKMRTLSQEEVNAVRNVGSGTPSRDSLALDDWEDLIPKTKEKPGTIETVNAKYLIGCDGTHSWTRKQLGIPFEGSTTEHIWGVMDVIPISDFPDMRRFCTLSTEFGTLLLIPRERQLMRLYVPMADVEEGTKYDKSSITLDAIREKVKAMMQPFKFDFKLCEWWSAYQIGQRLAKNVTEGRIYLAGDAVHTHSPKAGLGMNISMQDGFNIGWKIALVAKEVARPSILATYEPERHHLAKMLLDLDRRLYSLFLKKEINEDTQCSDLHKAMDEIVSSSEMFCEGLVAHYPASSLVHKAENKVASNLVAGERLMPVQVRNQSDGLGWWTTRLLESDGRFRILLLAGDVRVEEQKRRVAVFSEYLASTNSVVHRFTPAGMAIDTIIEVKTIHSAPWAEAELFDFPDILHAFDQHKGWDYNKIWSDSECPRDPQHSGKAYETWGVDRLRGAVVVVRLDQYVGWMGELEDIHDLEGYFEGVLQQQSL